MRFAHLTRPSATTTSRRNSFFLPAAALLCAAALAGCDAERPVRPDLRPGEPLFSPASSEPFFVAWSVKGDFRTSPIFTIVGGVLNAGQYRIQTPGEYGPPDPSVLTFAAANPGHLYFQGDEPDIYNVPPATIAVWYHDWVNAILGADPTAKFSPPGLAEPGAGGSYGNYTDYAQAFYQAHVDRFGVPPRVDEWRFHNFGGCQPERKNNLANWKLEVDSAARWSVARGAPMYLGGWNFPCWDKPQTQWLSDMQDAMAWLRNHPNIRGVAWWSYEYYAPDPWPHYLSNSDGSLTPEGETYHYGPMSVAISGNFVVSSGLECRWNSNSVGGVPPKRFDWVVNGSPWWNTQSIIYRNSGFPFTLSVTAYDKYGVARTNSRTVYISPNNPCWYLP